MVAGGGGGGRGGGVKRALLYHSLGALTDGHARLHPSGSSASNTYGVCAPMRTHRLHPPRHQVYADEPHVPRALGPRPGQLDTFDATFDATCDTLLAHLWHFDTFGNLTPWRLDTTFTTFAHLGTFVTKHTFATLTLCHFANLATWQLGNLAPLKRSAPLTP